MKRRTVLSIVSLFMLSGVILAAQPYNTKKAPRLLKAQSPTIIVKDEVGSKQIPIKTEAKLDVQDEVPVRVNKTVPIYNQAAKATIKNTAVSSSEYTPSIKELRKIEKTTKRAEKKANKAAANGNKSKLAAVLFCLFLGVIGVHRFYLGYTGIGLIQLFTLGFFGIWTTVDFILLLLGELNPKYGVFEKNMSEELESL